VDLSAFSLSAHFVCFLLLLFFFSLLNCTPSCPQRNNAQVVVVDKLSPRRLNPLVHGIMLSSEQEKEAGLPPAAPKDGEPPADTIPTSSDEKATATAQNQGNTTLEMVYPSGLKLALLMTSTFISMFLVALVHTLLCYHFFCSDSHGAS
jgi:hypothetical protein